MKKIIIIILIILMACTIGCTQEQYYEIRWNLNQDGITYEYILFLAETNEMVSPFQDTLANFPEQEWQQFLIGSFKHDSLWTINHNSAIIEFVPDPDSTAKYLSIALFAKSPQGFYADKASGGPVAIPAFIRPAKVDGIIISRKLRWK